MDPYDVFDPQPLSYKRHQLGEGTSLIDADTAAFLQDKEEKRLRLQGLAAEETVKPIQEQQYSDFQKFLGAEQKDAGLFKRGSDVGQVQHNILSKLGQGYNQAILSGEQDKYGRELGDLYNPETNEFLSQKALYHGIVGASRYATEGSSRLGSLGRAERHLREDNEWDAAADLLGARRRANPLAPKEFALTAADFARDPNSYKGPATVLAGRTALNEAQNWFWDDVEYGIDSVGNAFLGGADLITDFFSKEPNAIDRILKDREIEASFGPNRQHLNPFDENGEWKLEGARDYAKFFLGNFAVSAPYMGTLIASSAVPFGGAYAIPGLMYAGEVYNDQEEKDAGRAIIAGVGMGVLDKLGLDAIMRTKYGTKIFDDPRAMQRIIQEVAKKRGVSVEQASKVVAKKIAGETARFSDTYKQYITSQLKAGAIAKNAAAKLGIGTIGEGSTEALQELTQSWGATGQLDPAAHRQQLVTAAIAGGGIGGAMGLTGAGVNTLGLYDAVKSADKTTRQQAENVQAQARDKAQQVQEKQGDGTRVRTKSQVMKDMDTTAERELRGKKVTLEELAGDRKRGAIGSVKDYIDNRTLLGFWRSGFIDDLYDKYKKSPLVAALISANSLEHNGNIGANYESSISINQSMIETETGNQLQDEARFGWSSDKISEVMYDPINVNVFTEIAKAINNGTYSSFNEAYTAMNLPLTPDAQSKINEVLTKAEEMEEFWRTKSIMDGTQYTPGSFWNYRAVDAALVSQEREAISAVLASELGVDSPEVSEIVDELSLDDFIGQETSALEDFFDEGPSYRETLRAKVSDSIRNRPENRKYLENNIHVNQIKSSYGAGRTKANVEFYGEDTAGAAKGDRIARILELAEKRGEITPEEKAFLAGEFLDQMDINSGKYTQKLSPGLRAAQQHLMFFSTLAYLPLATVSSMVETGVLLQGIKPEQQFKMFQSLAKNLATETTSYIHELSNMPASLTGYNKRVKFDKTKLLDAASLTTSLGYSQTSKAAQARLTGGEDAVIPRWQTVAMDAFFRATMLTNWTDAMRGTVAGSAADVLWGWMEEVQINGTSTGYGREAAAMLAELGLDVDNFLEISKESAQSKILQRGKSQLTPEELQMESQIRSMLTNFVDQRVAMPTRSNRPKLYYDPRFKLFTHLTGYVATMSSTILPKLYKNLVRGTPGLSYGAFIVMANLFILGFLSQWLKDELKYGEPSPWLNDGKLFQRAVYTSGLLGVTERGIDIAFPLYENRKKGLEKYFLTAKDEAPALANLVNIGSGLFDLSEGETEQGVKTLTKSVPFIGPFYNLRQEIADYFK